MMKSPGSASIRISIALGAFAAGIGFASGTAVAQVDVTASSTTGIPMLAAEAADSRAPVGQDIRVLDTGSSGICLPIATGSNIGMPGCG